MGASPGPTVTTERPPGCTVRARLALAALVALAACRQQPGPPVFEVEPAARPIMQQWAEALGGRERLEKVKGWHFKSKLTQYGLTGTGESWLAPNGRSKYVSDVGPMHEVYATNGKRAWSRDTNGSVREYAGLELELSAMDELTSSIFMREPKRKGRVVKVSDTRVRFELEDNSTTAEVELDPKTFLPLTMTLKSADHTWTRRYQDWRSSAGIKQPFTVVTERDGQRSESRLTTVETMEPPVGTFAKPESLVADVKWTAPAPVALPLSLTNHGLPVVPVTISGKSFNFVVDTGSGATTVGKENLLALGLQSVGTHASYGAQDVGEAAWLAQVTYQVGGVTLGPQLVETWTFGQNASTPPIEGALGYDFFSRFVSELDVTQKQLRLHEAKGWKPPAGAIGLPITLEMGVPNVEVTLVLPGDRRVKARFVVDTGCACDLKLAAGFDADNQVSGALPDVGAAVSDAGTQGKVGTLPVLELGKLKVDNVPVQAPLVTTGFLAKHATAGLLGIRFLGRYVVFFDYASKKLYLVAK